MKRLAGLTLVLLLAGCSTLSDTVSSGFGLWGGKESGQKPSPLTEFKPSATARISWQASAGDAGDFAFRPALAAGGLFVAGHDGKLSRLDPSNGHAVWSVEAGNKLSGGVGAGDGIVVVGTAKGEALAFDAGDGHSLWKAQLSSEILSAPAVSGDIAVVRTGDGRIHGLDARTGERKWTYQRPNPALTLRSYGGILAEGGAVFAGFSGGKLSALDLASGAVGWEASVAMPRGATELERIADITSLPIIDASTRRIFAVAYQGRVACVDIMSGNVVWARDMSSFAGLAVDSRNVYVSDAKGSVVALDKASGASLWKQDKLTGRQLSAPAIIDGYVAVGDYEGYVHLLSREDGSFVARLSTDGSGIRVRPVELDGGAVVQTAKGGIFAVRVQ